MGAVEERIELFFTASCCRITLGRKGEVMAGVERRKFMRFNTVLHGSYEMHGGENGGGKAEIKNLSREGVGLIMDKELEKGAEVGLYLNVPGDNVPIYACAEVAWNKKADAQNDEPVASGLRFTKIDRYDRARLLDHVYAQWLKFLRKEA